MNGWTRDGIMQTKRRNGWVDERLFKKAKLFDRYLQLQQFQITLYRLQWFLCAVSPHCLQIQLQLLTNPPTYCRKTVTLEQQLGGQIKCLLLARNMSASLTAAAAPTSVRGFLQTTPVVALIMPNLQFCNSHKHSCTISCYLKVKYN